MKILHIAPTPFFAGRGCHLRILAEVEQLQAHGHEIMITTYHIGRKLRGLKINRIINIPWVKNIEVGGSWHKLYLDILLLWTSIRTASQFKPEAIHGHLHEGALIGWFVSLLTSKGMIPVIFDVQGNLSGELLAYGLLKKNNPLRYFFYTVEKLICRLPHFFICSSIASANFINTSMKVPDQKIITIVDGISPEFFTSRPYRKREKLVPFKDSKKLVIYTGSLTISKGINFFFQAIPRIIKNFDRARFLIVGYPIGDLQKTVKEMKIDTFIHFTGKVNYFELPDYLRIADVAVDPKVDLSSEGSSKIVNYMGAGLPVVCFDTLNNRLFLGENGFFATPGDSHDLADKVVYVLNHKARASATGESNKERANQLFSWNASTEVLSAVYEKLAQHTK